MTGMRLASVVLVLLGLLWPAGVASADHGVPLAATYKTPPPATMGAGTDVAVKVTLTNTGDDAWVPFVGGTAPAAGQVALSYHWQDPFGETGVWGGPGRPPGGGGVAAGGG